MIFEHIQGTDSYQPHINIDELALNLMFANPWNESMFIYRLSSQLSLLQITTI